jgi:hypothetical protein
VAPVAEEPPNKSTLEPPKESLVDRVDDAIEPPPPPPPSASHVAPAPERHSSPEVKRSTAQGESCGDV